MWQRKITEHKRFCYYAGITASMVVRFSAWTEDGKQLELNASDFVPGYVKPLKHISDLFKEETPAGAKKATDWEALRRWTERNKKYRKS